MEDESSLIDEDSIRQARELGVATTREVRSVGYMLDAYTRGDFDLNPPYQRNYVWSEKVACRLIESVMMNLTIPEIYVRRTLVNYKEHDDMVDGKQRCTTILNFFHNNRPAFWKGEGGFRLSGCKRMPCLNGLCYSDFTKKMLTRFHGYMLGVVAAKGGDDQAVGELFQYLNESTVPLTDQEIRNAVYQGPFNSLVKNLAALPEFQSVISKSLNLRMEAAKLVVRFVAFHRNGPAGYAQTAENKLPKFLNDEMEYWRQPGNFTDERARRLRSAFMNAITLSTAVFGKDVFRKKAGAKAQPSKILFELVMCNFANRDAALVLSKAEEIREALFELCAKNTEFELAISRATGDRNNVTYRFEAWEAALTEILGPSLRMPDDQEFPTVGAWLEHLQPTCESAPEALPETCPPVARKGRPLRLALPRWLNPAGAAEPAPAKVHEA